MAAKKSKLIRKVPRDLKGTCCLTSRRKQIKSANVALAIKKGSKLYNWNSKTKHKGEKLYNYNYNEKRECSSSDRMGSNKNDDMNL